MAKKEPSAPEADAGVKRRGLLRFGSLLTALSGASAISALGAKSAHAGPGDKNPPMNYVPVAEKGVASGVATLDHESTIPSAQLPDLSATYARTGNNQNTFTAQQKFNAGGTPPAPYVGIAADFTGDVDDTPLVGGSLNRSAASVKFLGGTNGVRGDDPNTTAANGAGATFFAGDYIAVDSEGGFKGKGSAQGYYFKGVLGAHATGAYGEFGGFLGDLTSNRPGALAEVFEMALRANVQAKNAVGLLNMLDNIGVSGMSATDWARGLWVHSGGTQRSGDGVFVSGPAGWTNMIRARNEGDTADVFRVDSAGRTFVGASGDAGAMFNLQTSNTADKGVVIRSVAAATGDFFQATDSTGDVLLGIQSSGKLYYHPYNAAATANVGTAGAPPAQVGGYLTVALGGAYVKIPYYAN